MLVTAAARTGSNNEKQKGSGQSESKQDLRSGSKSPFFNQSKTYEVAPNHPFFNQSKTYEVAPNHPFFNSLSHPPSPPLDIGQCYKKRGPPGPGPGSRVIIDITHHDSVPPCIKLIFCRPPPAPVDAFGSQGSRRATYHNPYLVSSDETISYPCWGYPNLIIS